VKKRRGTRTSDFGSPGRFGHDATTFYSSRLYDEAPGETETTYSESPLPSAVENRVLCKSSEVMAELPDRSIHLMVTSPPYNVGKSYDADLTLEEYLALIRRVMAEVHRVLVPGGRLCLNVANVGRKPYVSLESRLTTELLSLGFLMRGQVIWDKGASSSGSTAWGSWASAANPTLRDIHEYILVFSNGMFARPKIAGRDSTITRDDFLELTKSIWRFPAESAKRVNHPAPFPVELPRRCIELYTYANEVVLDPFMGSGSTAIAALESGRRFVGYETDQAFVEICQERIKKI
jgi:DNA modification methylase